MRRNQDFNSTQVQEVMARLGERIRAVRKAQKKSLADLESACRINRQTLGRLERGDPGVSLGVFLSALEALRQLADVELIAAHPGPVQDRAKAAPLDRDF